MDDKPDASRADQALDAVDAVVHDMRATRPDLDPVGLPITGRILRLAQFVADRREEALAEFGLTVADFDVLASLRRRAGSDPVKVRDLVSSMMLSSGGMTKRLDRLEAVGLLARGPDPADRRGVLIRLTPSGIDAIDRALEVVSRIESELVTTALDAPETRRQVEAGLRRLLLAHESG
ncbi:MAG: MarR family transcriptional regulator [Actinobacteria bacterium]|nr:MarR family transcriptional regulator [Actinomycetota bacterium]